MLRRLVIQFNNSSKQNSNSQALLEACESRKRMTNTLNCTSAKTKLNSRILNLKRSNNWRGKTALIRTLANEFGCSLLPKLTEKTYV